MSHGLKCPTVKAIEYFDDGATVKRVEFMTAVDYPHLPAASLPPPYNWPYTSTSCGNLYYAPLNGA